MPGHGMDSNDNDGITTSVLHLRLLHYVGVREGVQVGALGVREGARVGVLGARVVGLAVGFLVVGLSVVGLSVGFTLRVHVVGFLEGLRVGTLVAIVGDSAGNAEGSIEGK